LQKKAVSEEDKRKTIKLEFSGGGVPQRKLKLRDRSKTVEFLLKHPASEDEDQEQQLIIDKRKTIKLDFKVQSQSPSLANEEDGETEQYISEPRMAGELDSNAEGVEHEVQVRDMEEETTVPQQRQKALEVKCRTVKLANLQVMSKIKISSQQT
jgi:hypothetical protein